MKLSYKALIVSFLLIGLGVQQDSNTAAPKSVNAAQKTLVLSILNLNAPGTRLEALAKGSGLSMDQIVGLVDDPVVGGPLKAKLSLSGADPKKDLTGKLADLPKAGAGAMSAEDLAKIIEQIGTPKGPFGEAFKKVQADPTNKKLLREAYLALFASGSSGYDAAKAAEFKGNVDDLKAKVSAALGGA